MQKRRITVTVDEDVYQAAVAEVQAGRADSVSGWVNLALVRERENDIRLANLRELVAGHEADHGPITDERVAETERRDLEAAAAVRAARPRRRAG